MRNRSVDSGFKTCAEQTKGMEVHVAVACKYELLGQHFMALEIRTIPDRQFGQCAIADTALGNYSPTPPTKTAGDRSVGADTKGVTQHAYEEPPQRSAVPGSSPTRAASSRAATA